MASFRKIAALSFLFPLSSYPLAAQVITTSAGADFAFPPTPIAGADAPFGHVNGIATDSTGNAYVADIDNCLVFRIAASGLTTVVAGNGICMFSGENGSAINAGLQQPGGVGLDAAGNLYIREQGRIRKVSRDGIITTVGRNGTFCGSNGLVT